MGQLLEWRRKMFYDFIEEDPFWFETRNPVDKIIHSVSSNESFFSRNFTCDLDSTLVQSLNRNNLQGRPQSEVSEAKRHKKPGTQST